MEEMKGLVVKQATIEPVESNIESVRQELARQLETYAAFEVTNETDYKKAKLDRAELNKLIKSVDDERKRVKRIYEAPVKAFESAVKEVLEPARHVEACLASAIEKYNRACEDERRERLKAAYQEFAPYIACGNPPLVPLETIEAAAWYQRGTSEHVAMQMMQDRVETIAKGEAYLRMRLKDAGIAEREPEAMALYYKCLDDELAWKQLTDRIQREERVRQLEEQRLALQKAQEAAPEPEPEEKVVEVPKPSAERDEWRVEAWGMTKAQAMELRDWCKARGIKGKAERIVK